MAETGQMYRIVFPEWSFEKRLETFLKRRQKNNRQEEGCREKCFLDEHGWPSIINGHFFRLPNGEWENCVSIDIVGAEKNYIRHPYYHAIVAVCDDQAAAMEWYCKIMGLQYCILPLLKR